jgi:6-phosphogluconolactonase
MQESGLKDREIEPDTAPGRESGVDAAKQPGKVIAYASGYAPNIDWFSVDADAGGLTSAGSVASFGTSPSFLAVNPRATNLYAVDENTPGQVGAYSVDATTGSLGFLGAVSSGGDGPPFVSVDATGKWVLVANYTSGSVSVLPVQTNGSLGTAAETDTVGMEAHMILTDPTNHFAFVPCKGSDYVAQFLFDASSGKLTPNAVPTVATATGAGPRHLAFHPNGRLAYLINETNSTMSLYAFDSTAGTLTEMQTLSTIPTTFTGTNTAAEVHVHPSGAWLFGSNRGDDSIVVFSLDAAGSMTLVGFTPSGGMEPRDFTLDATGTFLYAANETTGNVVPFRFDAVKGTLTAVATSVTVPMASFIGLVTLASP